MSGGFINRAQLGRPKSKPLVRCVLCRHLKSDHGKKTGVCAVMEHDGSWCKCSGYKGGEK